MMPEDNYLTSITEKRKKHDIFMKQDANSPLTAEQKETFEGLNYFPVNKKFRAQGDLKEYDEKPEIRLENSKGETVIKKAFGQLVFKLDEQTFTLEIIKDEDGDSYFVPFADRTSGIETYGGGRYVTLQDPGSDHWIIDFNNASNVYCAYNDNWRCILAPPSNRLPIRIEAGEKKYHE